MKSSEAALAAELRSKVQEYLGAPVVAPGPSRFTSPKAEDIKYAAKG